MPVPVAPAPSGKLEQRTGLARLPSRVGNRNCARRGKTCRAGNQVPRPSREMRQSQRKPGDSTRAGIVGLSNLGHSRQQGGWVGDWIIEPSAVRILHRGGGYPHVRHLHTGGGFCVACFDRLRSPGFNQSRRRGIPLYASFLRVATDRGPGLHCAPISRAECRRREAIQVGPHRASSSPVGPLLHSTQQYRHGRSARVVRNSKGGLRE